MFHYTPALPLLDGPVFVTCLERLQPGLFFEHLLSQRPCYGPTTPSIHSSKDEPWHICSKRTMRSSVPGKFIAFEDTFGLDSWALTGGIIGLCVAARKKTLPGVIGWKRYVGASQAGWVAGSVVGDACLQNISADKWCVAQAAKHNKIRE